PKETINVVIISGATPLNLRNGNNVVSNITLTKIIKATTSALNYINLSMKNLPIPQLSISFFYDKHFFKPLKVYTWFYNSRFKKISLFFYYFLYFSYINTLRKYFT